MAAESSVPLFQLYKIAASADCDPRTARKLLRGEAVQPRQRARIESALRALELQHLLPAHGGTRQAG